MPPDRSSSLTEFHDRVGERIAELTKNEAAAVSCGAAAGLLLSAAACIVRDQIERVTELPDLSGFQHTEFIYWKSQRNGFLSAVRETGATLIEIGPTEEDLERAITDRTAAIVWFAGTVFADGALPLDRSHSDRESPIRAGGRRCGGSSASRSEPLEIHARHGR